MEFPRDDVIRSIDSVVEFVRGDISTQSMEILRGDISTR